MENLVSNAADCLQAFDYSGNKVRVTQIGGEPWFVLRDVCGVLGMSNAKVTADRLDEDEVSQTYITDSIGRSQLTTIINESGLYNVILRSDKPEAKPFRKWVTAEVIPSIRRTGGYSTRPMTPSELLLQQAQIMVEHEKRFERLEAQSARQEQKMEEVVEIFAVPSLDRDLWQQNMNKYISSLCERHGLSQQRLRGELYKELERTAGVNLESRMTRMRNRMKKAGAKAVERQTVTKLTIVASDKKLRPIFEGICRRYAAQLIC